MIVSVPRASWSGVLSASGAWTVLRQVTIRYRDLTEQELDRAVIAGIADRRSTSVQVDGTVTVMRPSRSMMVVVPVPVAGVVVVVVVVTGDGVAPGAGVIVGAAADTPEPRPPIPDLLTQDPEGPGHGIDRSRPREIVLSE